jgi:hypothetical protein
MPKFLEAKLKSEYGQNSSIPYKVMNAEGLMRGSKETAKGAALEKKHEEDMADTPKGSEYLRTEIEHHRDEGGKPTGHTIKHFPMPKATKSGAFIERSEPATHVFGAHEGKAMMAHLQEHLGIGAAKAAGTQEAEQNPSEHDTGTGEGEEIEEGQ